MVFKEWLDRGRVDSLAVGIDSLLLAQGHSDGFKPLLALEAGIERLFLVHWVRLARRRLRRQGSLRDAADGEGWSSVGDERSKISGC